MPFKPLLLILPGVTADSDRFAACTELAQKHWPEAEVLMPDYLWRWRGVRGVGVWLDAWVLRRVPEGRDIFVLAYILGGAALPYAPLLSARVKRAVLVRSGYQEQVPVALRRKLGPLAALFFGKSVWDLGGGPYWPAGYGPAWPHIALVEGKPSQAAIKLDVTDLSPEQLGLGAHEVLPLDHDFAYHSGKLMAKAVGFLKET